MGAALHSLAAPAAQARFALLHPALFSLWREGTSPYQILRDSLYRSFWGAPSVLIPVLDLQSTILVAVWPQKRVLEVYVSDGPMSTARSTAMVRILSLHVFHTSEKCVCMQDVAQFMSAMATAAGDASEYLPALSKGWVCRINVRGDASLTTSFSLAI